MKRINNYRLDMRVRMVLFSAGTILMKKTRNCSRGIGKDDIY